MWPKPKPSAENAPVNVRYVAFALFSSNVTNTFHFTQAPKIVRVEVPKIQIKYVPVVVKNKDDDSSEIELGPGQTTEIPTEKATSELRPVEYSSKQQNKYPDQPTTQIQGTIYVPQAVTSEAAPSSYSSNGASNSIHNYPSQSQRQYSAVYRHRQASMKPLHHQENSVFGVSQGRPPSYSRVGHHLNHLDHVTQHDQGVFGVTNALNPQNIGIEYAG